MGEIADQVARLERLAEEAQEALKLSERIGEEIETRIEEVEGVYGALLNLSGEFDTYIADHDYMAVERSAYELQGLVDDRSLYRTIDVVLQLITLQDGRAIPGSSIEQRMEEIRKVEASHPALTEEELDREFNRTLEQADATWRSIWDDGTWDSDTSREQHRDDHLYEARQEAVADRALRAGRVLMELCEYIAETLWSDVTGGLRTGDAERVTRALKAAAIAGDSAPKAYKLYEVKLSEQYEANPYSLGAVGEQVMAFESWVKTQDGD
ncbi:hypothetical protein ACIQWL_03000 [Streptomyces mirabilis]|uniref:hypothetical protein n=1 Tax=Streptomyces mirabilis TaxID=68239 RepID=UPI0033EF4085